LPNLKVYRVVHARDPVVHLPPYRIGFKHVGMEYWAPRPGAGYFLTCAVDGRTQKEDEHCSWTVSSKADGSVWNHVLMYGLEYPNEPKHTYETN
jgi:hypothetical protein